MKVAMRFALEKIGETLDLRRHMQRTTRTTLGNGITRNDEGDGPRRRELNYYSDHRI